MYGVIYRFTSNSSNFIKLVVCRRLLISLWLHFWVHTPRLALDYFLKYQRKQPYQAGSVNWGHSYKKGLIKLPWSSNMHLHSPLWNGAETRGTTNDLSKLVLRIRTCLTQKCIPWYFTRSNLCTQMYRFKSCLSKYTPWRWFKGS